MSIRKIRKNDVVVVMAGASRGKTGKIMQVFPAKDRAIVEGVNMVHKHLRRSQERPQGGMIDKEASIAISNLMLSCPACKKGVKVNRVKESGKHVRKCRKCGHAFDV